MIFRSGLSRRSLLAGGLASTISATAPFRTFAAEGCRFEADPTIWKARAERAVSLRQLVAEAQAGKTGLRLQGLTRLDGYVVDKEQSDIILWGLAERDHPDLYLDDLVVALRVAFDRYTEEKDGVRYRVSPLISIDPDPVIWQRLREINIWSSGGFDSYEALCSTPQRVRVEGMPRNTRVAKALVDADYRMKRVTQGSLRLPISSPFPADFDARVAYWRSQEEAGLPADKGSPTRYWFQPGRFSFQASDDSDTVFMDVAQVVLNDEVQVIKAGELVAAGKTDPITRAFTCAWTSRMEDVYKAEPIWRDMHNIFRGFALARVMSDRQAFVRAGFDPAFLLNTYELANVSVPPSLAGLSRIIEYKTSEGRRATSHAPVVCGGVSVGFGKPLDQNPEAAETRTSGNMVVAARPTKTALAWSIDPSSIGTLFGGSRPSVAPPRSPPPAEAPSKSLKDLFKT